MNAWSCVLTQMRERTSRESYKNWLEPIRFLEIETGGSLRLAAPNENVKSWLESEYLAAILGIAAQLNLGFNSVEVSVDARAAAPAQPAFDFQPNGQRFNEKYTFDKFVVGSCNDFAHAAAHAVADNPAKVYNPLYLYASVGMGKTHLMQAVGSRICATSPQMKVIYVSAEEFMNDMVNSIRYDRMRTFHERFRTADVLLVDDIQTLGTRERTQEEFFHTFNALHNNGKQIVISSDSAPNGVKGLMERLKSRFSWGLIVDIQPPDLETKMAILTRKAEDAGAELPSSVLNFMATHFNSNIRELEGALIRLMAVASISGTDITAAMARQSLRTTLEENERTATIANIQQVVAAHYKLRTAQLCGRSNSRAIALPRQVAMYLCRRLTSASLPEIGRAFGGKHHTTVLHAAKKIADDRLADEDLDAQINTLTDRFHAV